LTGRPMPYTLLAMRSPGHRYGVPFPTSVVGSLPRPSFVRDLISQAKPLAEEEYKRRMGAAVRYAVALQEQAGLDIVSDGEWWRRSYFGVMAELAHGFELGTYPDGRPYAVVVDPIAPRRPGFIAEEARFLRSITGSMFKVTLPAPALLGERLWDARRSARAYPKREAFVEACVPILRRELELLAQEGPAIVQIDDPHLCLFVDPEVRARHADPDVAADFAVAKINELVEGIHRVRLAVHLCRRAGARVRGEARHHGAYDAILPQLNRLRVHQLTMEFTAPGAGDVAVLAQLREDFEVGLGCVSCHPGEVDSVDTIVERVARASAVLGPARILLNPDCGFAPGSGAIADIDEVYQKLKNQSDAARRLREMLG
jgi:5-methyltetrahydropteroyltriglutamate--homocysteine methyltransferase